MQNREQGRVDDQGLGITHQLGQDGAPQGFQEAPEVAYPPVQRGGMEAYDPGEQVREEPGGLAQEGAFGLHTSKLLEKSEGYDLRIRELLEGLVASPFGVEPVVDVVYVAEQYGYGLFQEGQMWGKLGLGHPMLLWSGSGRMASFLHCRTAQHTSS